MGKRNPFNYKSKSSNKLLLFTDLKGQITHVIGNPRIINSTIRDLYLQNFFKKFLTNQSCRQLYDELQSTEVMPSWTNSRLFKSSIKGTKRSKMFKINCYRIFVKFSTEISIEKKVSVNVIKGQKQFAQLRNEENVEEAIMVYIEPQLQMQVSRIQYDLQPKATKTTGQQSVNLVSPEQLNYQPIFETPKKKAKNQEQKADNTTNLLMEKFQDAK